MRRNLRALPVRYLASAVSLHIEFEEVHGVSGID